MGTPPPGVAAPPPAPAPAPVSAGRVPPRGVRQPDSLNNRAKGARRSNGDVGSDIACTASDPRREGIVMGVSGAPTRACDAPLAAAAAATEAAERAVCVAVDGDVEGDIELALAGVVAVVAGALRVRRASPPPAASAGNAPVDVELARTASQRSGESARRLRADLDIGRTSVFE